MNDRVFAPTIRQAQRLERDLPGSLWLHVDMVDVVYDQLLVLFLQDLLVLLQQIGTCGLKERMPVRT